ncbi:MAG: SgcJ/EcaC family oxidoreductase [Acidobacteria bacterium]|nr:SgcJ/EcaC family oxidoreductase [Acidobacteriota bacterium]
MPKFFNFALARRDTTSTQAFWHDPVRISLLDVYELKTLKDSAGANTMTILQSKKAFFVLLILFCGSYSMNAQNPTESELRGVSLKPVRSDAGGESNNLSGASNSSPNTGNSLSNNAPQTSDSEMTKVRRAIDAGNAVWVEAWAKGDATMLLDTFTADGKELVAGGKVFKGRKQILALMSDTMSKRGGKAKLTVTTTDVWLDLNTAYETGTAVYEFTVDGRPQTLERRYFTIWKRQSNRGVWKIYANTGVAKQ